MKALRKLIFGETWTLPLGIAAVLLLGGLVVKPLLSEAAWRHAGGPLLLAGVALVLVVSVARSARGG